jgi:tripartite-type tricarboxylate transporter receptor subunit TctC
MLARFAWLGLCLIASCAAAQTYPIKPIRLLVPFPPGGSSDLVARSISPKLGELLGQPIIGMNPVLSTRI